LHTPDIYLRILDFSLINIIENLLTNSIRKLLETMDSGSKWIKITSRDERIDNQDYTVLEWKDNGPGVQDQRKRTIFEGDSDKEEEGDHGIGLSDIKTTIEAVGGFIREIGAYGKGATFVVGFPKVYEVSEPDLDGDGKNEVHVEFPPTLASKHVLIIAGDGDMLDNYMNFFKTSGLQGVRGADSCKQALGFVLDHKFTPDLLIADIDGIEEDSYILLDELKANAFRVPTIIFSKQLFQKNGYRRDDLMRLERSGVGDVLEKPIDFALLSRLAQKHLSAVEPEKMLHQEKRDNSQRN
ncbi:MAG: ATP-binding protein, partial [Spirochaetia bacterium]